MTNSAFPEFNIRLKKSETLVIVPIPEKDSKIQTVFNALPVYSIF